MPQNWLLISVILCAFLVGIYFKKAVYALINFARHGGDGFREKPADFTDVARTSKVVASLSVLISISIITWLINYLLKGSEPNSIWVDVTSAVFGVTTAALLGGVIFELLLRRELMYEISSTLANIITLDKQIVKEIFTPEKRNEIIRTLLQLNAGNDIYGDAIYSDFVTRFISDETKQFREFRFSFSDQIKYSEISPDHPELSNKYYIVKERIRYKAELRPNNFVIGCAANENQLYDLFSDPTCLYRWLLKAEDFETLMTQRQGFLARLTIDGVVCETLNEHGIITSRGYELTFQNPFTNPAAPKELRDKIGKFVEFQIETNTLHDKQDRIVSIHLVYPVKGVEISFDYESSKDIGDVIALHFLSPGRHKSRGGGEIIEEISEPLYAPKQRKVIVNVPENTWLFPDSGIIIVW